MKTVRPAHIPAQAFTSIRNAITTGSTALFSGSHQRGARGGISNYSGVPTGQQEYFIERGRLDLLVRIRRDIPIIDHKTNSAD